MQRGQDFLRLRVGRTYVGTTGVRSSPILQVMLMFVEMMHWVFTVQVYCLHLCIVLMET